MAGLNHVFKTVIRGVVDEIEQDVLRVEYITLLTSQTCEGLIGPQGKSLPIVSMAKVNQRNIAEKHLSVGRRSPVLGYWSLEKGV
jgi:hypothetical protein